jgi:superfamily II DNA or RNA helicase
MRLRPYQHEFVDLTLGHLVECDRVLAVMSTGGGKTPCAGEIIRRTLDQGPCLFIADAQELVRQAADKIGAWTGLIPQVEMADAHAQPGDRLVVGSTQTLCRRLDRWPRDYFKLIVVDEAHRNTLGGMAQKVLGHFASAQVVGITATPFRSDKQQLGTFYQTVTCEIGLVRLIREGWLSRILIRSVPAGIDLTQVRTVAGDYREDDLGQAIEPHLFRCAEILAEHAPRRRTVVFLPLIDTSRKFVAACQSLGLRAVHVDGNDRAGLDLFRSRQADIIANAQLLSTGWDQPDVDCVMVLRPTKSLVLYSQMIGRGTRICEGKDHLLVLDPLFLSDSMDLIRPARLLAHTPAEAQALQEVLDDEDALDLLDASERAASQRRQRLAEELAARAHRNQRTVDALEFALSLGEAELADYEPETAWENQPPTGPQVELLARAGFDLSRIMGKGHASKLIDLLFRRRDLGLATPKQVRWLTRFNHPSPHLATFEEASAYLDQKFGGKRRQVLHAP